MLGLLAVGLGANAQTPPAALDLSLPEPSTASDPPGKFYGDTDGGPGRGSAGVATTQPDAPQVWGSVSTGIGYSKGYGNSHWSAADINVSKAYGEGGRNRVDLHINVEQSDGPGFGPYHSGIHGFDRAYDRERLPPPR